MDKIKKIISVFINLQADLITENTIIDRTVIQGSVLIHRMYAEIEKSGYKIHDYSNIHTFGDILKKLNGETDQTLEKQNPEIPNLISPNIEENATKIGIDIEEVSNFNMVDDFREDNFYKQNFSDKEISYCILQPNILQSFAGKFTAKEAIVKADYTFKNIPFNKIEILNNDKRKPYFSDFELSISHTRNLAIAVAVKIAESKKEKQEQIIYQQRPNTTLLIILPVLAIIISIASLMFLINFIS